MQKESKRIEELGEWYKDKKEGLQKLIEGHAESKKQEQAEKQNAHSAQVRRGQVQKKASKDQKMKRQEWEADITKDNIMYNTPKGSGSSSRSRTA